LRAFEQGARILFSFPRLRFLLPVTAATAVAAYLVGCKLTFIVYTLAILPLLLKLTAPSLINLRRALGLTPLFLAWGAVLTVLREQAALLPLPPGLLLAAVTRFLSGSRLASLLVLSSALATVILGGATWSEMVVATSASLLSLALVEAFASRLGRSLADFGGPVLLESYLQYILGGNRRALEAALLQLSVEREVPVYALELLDESGPWGLIAIPHVHPGPFKDLGSSRLPSLLIDAALRKGLFCAVLHGASTHSEDLVREEDAMLLVERILAGEGEVLSEGARLGVAVHTNAVHRAVALALEGGWCLTIVERVDGGMEDIPLRLVDAIDERVVLIDAHNSYDSVRPSPSPDSPLGRSIVECASLAAHLARSNMSDRWLVSASHLTVRLLNEVGGGGASLVRFSHPSGTECLLLSFDANNMFRTLRDEIYAKLGGRYTIIVATTTDTHELTGGRAGETYSPLGARHHLEEYLAVVNALISGLADAKPLRYRLRRLRLRSRFLDDAKLLRLGALVDSLLKEALGLFVIHFVLFLIPLLV